MPYDALAAALEDPTSVSVATLPDGSVDTHCHVRDRDERVESRAAFAERVADEGRSAVTLQVREVTPGGQAVNMARQAAALGDAVTCYGHLDDPRIEGLPFETRSMGSPAEVTVLRFEKHDLMLAAESRDILEWDVADLRAAAGSLDRVLDADAVCCGNWVSLPNAPAALHALADAAESGGAFVLDPGDIGECDDDDLDALLDGFARVSEPFEAALSVDGSEVSRLADHVGASDPSDPVAAVDAVRAHVGGGTVVRHAERAAVASGPAGTVRVPNLATETVETDTGAGDRFSAGLAHGMAAGWELGPTLALGNACAARYVATGETGGPDALREFVRTAERL